MARKRGKWTPARKREWLKSSKVQKMLKARRHRLIALGKKLERMELKK